MVRLVFRHLAEDERFARRYRNEPSPEIHLTLPFFRHFLWFSRALLLLKPLSRSRSVAGVHVCVRVCVCECVCCVLCACGKTLKTRGNREKCVWYGVCVVSKRSKNWPFSPTHCFYTFPGICRRFWPEVLSQTPKNVVFDPRSYSKCPNHALEKVLTNETPDIFYNITAEHNSTFVFLVLCLQFSIFQMTDVH